MNDYSSLFSHRFFAETWQYAERSLRKTSCWRQISFYTLNEDNRISYWTVRTLPLRSDAFKAAANDIKLALSSRQEVVCIVAPHDDPALVARLGGVSSSWKYALVYMLDNEIVYIRSVFAVDCMQTVDGPAAIYLLSNAIRQPTFDDINEEYERKLTSLTVLCAPRGQWYNAEELQPDWQCESAAGKMPFVVKKRDTFADVEYWYGPSSTARAHAAALGGLGSIVFSAPDGIGPSRGLSVFTTSTDVRFRWPFHFERLLALCLCGTYVLPVDIVLRILSPSALIDMFDRRFLKCWSDMVASVRRIRDARSAASESKRIKQSIRDDSV